MKLSKKMEKESARKEIEAIREKIVGENILSLLKEDVKEDFSAQAPGDYLLASVMAGIVFWDDEKNCLIQKLFKPLKSGEQSREELHYKGDLNLGLLRDENTPNEIAASINVVSRLTGASKQLIEKLCYQDLSITQEITSFFFAR